MMLPSSCFNASFYCEMEETGGSEKMKLRKTKSVNRILIYGGEV
jgi:hypothetical protein